MRRLWLRWALLIVFVAILGAVFVNLGSWQLDRLAQRKARNSTTVTNESRPVRPFTDIFTREIRDADQWQRVEARGTFDAEHQFVLRYRRNGNAEVYEVVTPLRLRPPARSPSSDTSGATSRVGGPPSPRSPARCD